MSVRPCPRYLTGGDTHILCVACLGEERAQLNVLESTLLRGTAEATVLGFANGSVSGVRDEHSLISTFT